LDNCPLFEAAELCAPYRIVRVPETFADLAIPQCYRYRADIPAGCAPTFGGSSRETVAVTYVGRYPPLYYAVVGLPSLISQSSAGVYLMRLLSGALSSIFLGLALAMAVTWTRSRLLLLALAVTVTPMVIVFGSAVNPSGLEMATAVCVWTGGLILVLDRSIRPPPSLVAATAVSAAVMELMRGLSPLLLGVMAVFLFSLRPRSLWDLLRSRSVRWSAAAVTITGIVATTYVFLAQSLAVTYVGGVPAGASDTYIIEVILGRTSGLVDEFIGTIGWVQSNPPLASVVLWVVPAATVVVLGFATSLRRHAMVLVAIVIASLVIPGALMLSQAHRAGLTWQARYGFPLYAGLLLVAGAVAGNGVTDSGFADETGRARVFLRRLTLFVAVCIGIVQVGDFVWALRRYTVGLGTTVDPFARVRGGWSPPISSWILVVVATIAVVVYCWWIVRLERVVLDNDAAHTVTGFSTELADPEESAPRGEAVVGDSITPDAR
jgi:hypothetical protein